MSMDHDDQVTPQIILDNHMRIELEVSSGMSFALQYSNLLN